MWSTSVATATTPFAAQWRHSGSALNISLRQLLNLRPVHRTAFEPPYVFLRHSFSANESAIGFTFRLVEPVAPRLMPVVQSGGKFHAISPWRAASGLRGDGGVEIDVKA